MKEKHYLKTISVRYANTVLRILNHFKETRQEGYMTFLLLRFLRVRTPKETRENVIVM